MDKNKPRYDRAKRQEELSKQEELIARKKQEILERLNNKNIGNDTPVKAFVKPSISVYTNSGSYINKNVNIQPTETHVKVKTEPSETFKEPITGSLLSPKPIKISLPIINRFKNDGSFLEQFKSLQSNKKKEDLKGKKIDKTNDSAQIKQESTTITTSSHNHDIDKRDILNNYKGIKKEPQNPINESGQRSSIVIVGQPTKVQPFKQHVTVDVKQKQVTKDLPIEKREILSNIATSHCQLPNQTIEKEIDDALRLVRQESSREISSRSAAKAMPQPPSSEPVASSSIQDVSMMSYDKMRWSSERTIDASKDPALCQYAKQVFGTIDLTTDQWKQLEDQRKMKALFEVIQQRFDLQPSQSITTKQGATKDDEKKHKKYKYAYDSDEEIDPNEGTWEHKKRRKEMEKTKDWAQSLTQINRGKRHLGDYLPPQELEKFMKKWESIQEGNISQLSKSDYDDFKIQCDNIGYKMMMKLGWKEGQGLGAGEIAQTSIREPIKATSNYNGAGLGANDPTELNEGDDIYEAYRKRMMLAYRFRPNPLNNPRRPYY